MTALSVMFNPYEKARTFDLEAMLGQTIKSAQERSKDILEAREKEHEEAQLEKIEKAKKEKQKEKANVVEAKKAPVEEKEEEDDFAGPAIPAGFVPTVFKAFGKLYFIDFYS